MVTPKVLARLRRLLRDRRAVSAVEFALVLPVMLTIYLGGNEIGNGLTLQREVGHVASTIGDLVAQCTQLSDSDMSNILAASSSVIAPYSTTLLRVKVSGVTITTTTQNGKTTTTSTVAWSDAYQDTALTKNAVLTNVPAAITASNTFIVVAEVHYAYTPYIGYVMTGTFDLHNTLYFAPRDSASIARATPTKCS